MTLEEPLDPTSADRLLSALATDINRNVVSYFRESAEDAAPIHELAGYVADRGDRSFEQVTLRLHHGGLPKLADVGLLEYDPGSKTAHRRDHPVFEVEDVGEFLDIV
jgi:hypothetical protein